MVVLNLLIFLVSCVVLVVSSAILLKSLTKIARLLRISEFVIAFILMALFTSLPELVVGVIASLHKLPTLILGTVIGSNIADLTFVAGVAILIARSISVKEKVIKRESYFMFGICLLPVLLMIDKVLSRIDGVVLLAVFFIYMFFLYKRGRITIPEMEKVTFLETFKNFGLFMLGIILLLGSAELVVRYAKIIALDLKLPDILIGLFLVAIGTSLPELIFESRAVLRGKKEMALGDIMGSVVANSTLVLGIAALIFPLSGEFFYFITSAYFMILTAFIFITFMRSEERFSIMEGIALLMMYFLFIMLEFYLTKNAPV